MNRPCGAAGLGLEAFLAACALTVPGASGLSILSLLPQSILRPPVRAAPELLGDFGLVELNTPAPAEGRRGTFEDIINEGIGAAGRAGAGTVPGAPNRNDTSSPRTQSEVAGVTLNGEADTGPLLSAMAFSSCAVLVVLALFSVLRRLNPAVFSRDFGKEDVTSGLAMGGVEESRNGCVACLRAYTDWFRLVRDAQPQEEVRRAGLDGWVLLEFHRLNARILLVVGTVVLAVLCPLHFVASRRLRPTMDFISRLDVDNIPDGSSFWWVHAGLVWFVVGVSTFCIRGAHEDFLERRFKWLQELPAPQVNTILVENIPEEYRSDRALKEYFERIFGRGSVERAYMVRRTEELRAQVGKFELVKYNLMIAEKRWQQAGKPESVKGLMDIYRYDLKRLGKGVLEARAVVEEACSGEEPASTASDQQRLKFCSPSGFVTFSSQLAQRLASGEQYRTDSTEITVCAAPDPSDVIYDNLEEESNKGRFRELVGWLWLICIFVLWSPIVVFISSFTTVSRLEAFFPAVATWCSRSPRLASFLEGVLATAALKLFLAFLPSILLSIVQKFFLLKAGAWAQLQLERWYFAFLTTFVLLVTIIGRSLILTVAVLVQQPVQLLDMMAESLPSASHFYFNYFILGWLTHAWEMVRCVNLCKYWFYKVFYKLPPETAKQYAEPEDPGSFGMGTRMGYSALMSAITFVFCTCSPLIVVFAYVYFNTGRMAYGYLLVRAETKKPDLGGRFWMEALSQVYFALTVYVLLMTGVLATHGGLESHAFARRFGPALLAFVSLFALFLQWRKVNDLAWESLPLQVLAEASFAPQGENGQYVQKECVSSLELEEELAGKEQEQEQEQ